LGLEMKIARFLIQVGWPSLPSVFLELASLLGSDDWERRSTDDGKELYYVIGLRAWTAEQNGERSFNVCSSPLLEPVEPGREAEVHALTAAVKPFRHYVDRAAARLVDTGVDRLHVATFVNGFHGEDVNWNLIAGKFMFPPGSESRAAFGATFSKLWRWKRL
jgi:hypothetical protein